MKQYILNDEREVVPSTDLMDWARWFETADRHVALDTVNGVRVSTVFLGIDHDFTFEGPPLLFETMTFDGPEEICERCSTWDEAVAQHARVVQQVGGTADAAGETKK